jgi:hypothetical protein
MCRSRSPSRGSNPAIGTASTHRLWAVLSVPHWPVACLTGSRGAALDTMKAENRRRTPPESEGPQSRRRRSAGLGQGHCVSAVTWAPAHDHPRNTLVDADAHARVDESEERGAEYLSIEADDTRGQQQNWPQESSSDEGRPPPMPECQAEQDHRRNHASTLRLPGTPGG